MYTAKHLRDRKLQRTLLQFFKPENYFEVRDALMKANRSDLIGNGCDCLIPSNPPKEALRARMEKRASRWARGSMSTRSAQKAPARSRKLNISNRREEDRVSARPEDRPTSGTLISVRNHL